MIDRKKVCNGKKAYNGKRMTDGKHTIIKMRYKV